MDFGETDWHCDVKTDRLVGSLFGSFSTSDIYTHEDVSRKKTSSVYSKHKKSRKTTNKDDSRFASVNSQSRLKIKKRNKKHHQGVLGEEKNGFRSIGSNDKSQTKADLLKNLSISKKRKRKSDFEDAQCQNSLKEIKKKYLDKQRETTKSKTDNSSVEIVSETVHKSPKKRKRLCKRNKYKHLVHSDGDNISNTLLNQQGHVCRVKAVERMEYETIASKTSDHMAVKHLDASVSVNETKKHRKQERLSLPSKHVKLVKKKRCSLPVNSQDRNNEKRNDISEEMHRTRTRHKDNKVEIVKNPKLDTCKNKDNLFISPKSKSDKKKLMAVRESANNTNEKTVPVKKREKKLHSKQNKFELMESVSSVGKDVIFRSSDGSEHIGVQTHDLVTNSSKTTVRKNNLPFSVEKLTNYLSRTKNKTQGNKIDKKLKCKPDNILKTTNVARSQFDNFMSPDTSTKPPLEKFGGMKKKKTHLSLQEKLRYQLSSSRFRYLSEQMYTKTGSEAKTLFTSDKEAFRVYHEGYQAQVNKWPLSPLSVMIREIKKESPDLIVADFGCGEAILAQSVPNTVHSFDLVALNKHVTACDMSKVPLNTGSVDIAVFCLSLMGTNLTDYLCEASRVLKKGGLLKIAEVASRFEKKSKFARNVERMGFQLANKNTENKMFYLFDFVKVANVRKDLLPQIILNPCLYKKR